MPIYEYVCKKCNHEFEVISFSSSGAADDVQCPSCGERDAEKLMSTLAKPGCGGSCASCSPSAGST
ncbi:MAG: zinc ribbon domain-containing protein [Deltaproteobacteria bacterium]|nr:zinc ribbon domain-containing protein [Deltaproteobacteria bacterium]